MNKLFILLACIWFSQTNDCYGSAESSPTNDQQNSSDMMVLEKLKPQIINQISSLIYNAYLHPYIEKGEVKLKTMGFENPIHHRGEYIAAVMLTELSQGEKNYLTTFLIIFNTKTNELKIHLLYLGNKFISTQLFMDIRPFLESQVPKHIAQSDKIHFHLNLIKQDNADHRVYKFTTFGPTFSIENLVETDPASDGGTDFRVLDMKKVK